MNFNKKILTSFLLLFISCSSQANPKSIAPATGKDLVRVNLKSTAHQKINIELGKAKVIRFSEPITRVASADPRVVDVITLSDKEIYVLGKESGASNILIWHSRIGLKSLNVQIILGVDDLLSGIKKQFPEEKNIKVTSSSNTIVVSGSVDDSITYTVINDMANAHAKTYSRRLYKKADESDENTGMVVARSSSNLANNDNSKQDSNSGSNSDTSKANTLSAAVQNIPTCASEICVLNLLTVTQSQQVMLDVKVAEIRKDILEQLGVGVTTTAGNVKWQLITQAATGGLFSGKLVKRDTLVKILAEPTIVAMSGEVGSFLAGGKLLIPVLQSSGGTTTNTLREQDYGIGLNFFPLVGKGGLIKLKVNPEVTEILPSPLVFGSGANTTTIPAFTTRRVSTTVQIREGQSLIIGGLLSNNVTETVRAVPLLGEIPILGALFRSSEFVNAKTELVIIVSPRLAKPTDFIAETAAESFSPPTRSEFFLEGKMEGAKNRKPSGAGIKK
jgi:pilus assembly protein CpaC